MSLEKACPSETVRPAQDIIDIQGMLDLFPPQAEFRLTIRDLLVRVCSDAKQMLTVVEDAWQQGRAGEAIEALHKARGGIGSMGARHFADLTLDIETAMRDEHRERVDASLPLLVDEVAALTRVINDWLASES